MAHIGYLWPPARGRDAARRNIAPCGSDASVLNRTNFPLSHGVLALLIQGNSSNTQVSISYKENPTSNDDFTVLIELGQIKDIDQGYRCYPIPDPLREVKDGTVASLQAKYQTQSGRDETKIFYACADIRYISTSKFDTQVPCFNVTVGDFITPNRSSTAQPGSHPTVKSDIAGGSGTGLTRGEVAGIAIGVLVGVILIVLSYIGYLRYQQRRGNQPHKLPVRNTSWDGVGNIVSAN
ncbi:hypothetical protein MauCBS54593_002000 [Microsporum audouinii]